MASSLSSRHSEPVKSKQKQSLLDLGLVFLFVFLFFFFPSTDTDLWWHLRYGQYFWQFLTPWRENELTYFLPGYQWKLCYFLFQATIYPLYKSFGLLGLSILNSLFFVFLGMALFAYTKKILFAFLILVMMAGFGWFFFSIGLRPQNFALLGITLLLVLLKKGLKNPNLFFLIPLLVLFWANIHGSFVLSLAILTLFIFSCFLQKQKNLVRKGLFVLFLSLLAGFFNPFGLAAYGEFWRHITYPLKFLIAEWVPPDLIFKLTTVAIGLPLLFFLAKKPKENLFLILLLVFFGNQVFLAKRNTPLYGLVFCLVLSDWVLTNPTMKKVLAKVEKIFPSRIILLSLIFILTLTRVPETFSFLDNREVFCRQSSWPYPCQAIDWIQKQAFLGQNVFTAYEWGGFLEWNLPSYKPFVDSRMVTWPTPSGKSPYTIYLEIIQAQPSWEKTLEENKTDWLLIGTGTFLDLKLKKEKHPLWQLVYSDELASVYIKR